jgi:hypothetical protein
MSLARIDLSVVALASAVVFIAGCGGDSSSAGVARLSSGTSSASTSSAAVGGDDSASPASGSPEAAALAFARCMRSGGVPNFPDPKAGGGFLFHTGAGVDPSSPAFKTAQAKCKKFLPNIGGPGSGPTPSAQALAHWLKVSQCMRRDGISNFPDPRTTVPSNPRAALGGSGVISDIEGVIFVFPHTINTQSPAFKRAAAACTFPLHNH